MLDECLFGVFFVKRSTAEPKCVLAITDCGSVDLLVTFRAVVPINCSILEMGDGNGALAARYPIFVTVIVGNWRLIWADYVLRGCGHVCWVLTCVVGGMMVTGWRKKRGWCKRATTYSGHGATHASRYGFSRARTGRRKCSSSSSAASRSNTGVFPASAGQQPAHARSTYAPGIARNTLECLV